MTVIAQHSPEGLEGLPSTASILPGLVDLHILGAETSSAIAKQIVNIIYNSSLVPRDYFGGGSIDSVIDDYEQNGILPESGGDQDQLSEENLRRYTSLAALGFLVILNRVELPPHVGLQMPDARHQFGADIMEMAERTLFKLKPTDASRPRRTDLLAVLTRKPEEVDAFIAKGADTVNKIGQRLGSSGKVGGNNRSKKFKESIEADKAHEDKKRAMELIILTSALKGSVPARMLEVIMPEAIGNVFKLTISQMAEKGMISYQRAVVRGKRRTVFRIEEEGMNHLLSTAGLGADTVPSINSEELMNTALAEFFKKVKKSEENTLRGQALFSYVMRFKKDILPQIIENDPGELKSDKYKHYANMEKFIEIVSSFLDD